MCQCVQSAIVYRHECPGHEKLSIGLSRRPATQAPVSGTVPAMPYCVENSNHSDQKDCCVQLKEIGSMTTYIVYVI